MTANLFAVPSKIPPIPTATRGEAKGVTRAVFFICFRECLETGIIVSVLLAFLKQTLGAEGDRDTYRKLVRQVRITSADVGLSPAC